MSYNAYFIFYTYTFLIISTAEQCSMPTYIKNEVNDIKYHRKVCRIDVILIQ